MNRTPIAAVFFLALLLPHAAAFAVTLYGTNSDTGILYRIDTNGVGNPFVTGLNNPNALTVAPDGTVFVRTTVTADRNSPFEILKINSLGNTSVYLTGLTNPYSTPPLHEASRYTDALGLDSQGNLFVANAGPAFPEGAPPVPAGFLPIGVLRVDPGGAVTQVGDVRGDYDAIIVDRADTVYAGELSAGLYRISTTGPDMHVAALRIYSGVAASNGSLFLSPLGGVGIYELRPDVGFGPRTVSDVGNHLAIDSQDFIYGASGTHVVKLTPDLQAIVQFSNTPVMSIAALPEPVIVPEPSAWILLAVGAAALSFVGRRRR